MPPNENRFARRWWWIGIGLMVAPLLVVASMAILSGPPHNAGPVYQGRTAEQWLREIYTTNHAAALFAFQQMGSNATPFLLRAFEKADRPWDKCYQWAYPKLPALFQRRLPPPVPARRGWSSACVALNQHQAYGTERQERLAGLLRLLQNTNNLARAYLISPVIGLVGPDSTNAVPVLIKCVQSNDPDLRRETAVALWKTGPTAKEAIPALTAALKDPDLEIRLNVAMALWRIGRQTNAVVPVIEEMLAVMPTGYVFDLATRLLSQAAPQSPALLSALIRALELPNSDNSDDGFRSAFIVRLGEFGPAAKAGVPALVRIIQEESILRDLALPALKKIDPEEAAKWDAQSPR